MTSLGVIRTMQKRVIIYRITHKESGRSYIGITAQEERVRWIQHRSDARNPHRRQGALHRAIHKYGVGAFLFEVIGSAVDVETGAIMERALIADLGTMVPNGFNLTSGGEILVGTKLSEATKKKVGDSMRKQWAEGTRKNTRSKEERSSTVRAYYAANPKQPESDETRARKAAAGRAYWDRRRVAAAAGDIQVVGHPGHRNTEETKKKLAVSVKRSWETRSRDVSEDVRAKLSEAGKAAYQEGRRVPLRGFVHTPESRAKMSESMKASCARRRAERASL